MKLAALLLAAIGVGLPFASLQAGTHVSPLDSLAIIVRSPSREFAYTNKESAFLYGETNGDNTTSWQGFNVFGSEVLDDYRITIDGHALDRAAAITTVFPDYLRRTYPDGIIEEVRPADSLALFFVTVTAQRPVEIAVMPLFTDGIDTADFTTDLFPAGMLVARRARLGQEADTHVPLWLAVSAAGFSPAVRPVLVSSRFSPAVLAASRCKSCTIVFNAGHDARETRTTAERAARRFGALCGARRHRMESLLAATAVTTNDRRFDKALAWAKISLDDLIMNQITKGIFAGLPWFNNYWGRDTFISLPGAVLVTGRFNDAREILRSFASFQQRDSLSRDYGRIPNIVTTTEKAFNTADGTPRFVMMVREYVERSGDSLFGMEMYPCILRAIEGTIRYHCDSLSFLTHADAETWMDAIGPDGPWSPRGNRANDVQALWAAQLEAGEKFATEFGDVVSARRWHQRLVALKENFPRWFSLPNGIADCLGEDGKPDMRLRPNQIFVAPLLSDPLRIRVVESVTSLLAFPYGVTSLSQEDPDFHPYHQHAPFYPKDAAYHNGTVWTWLQGRLISELCRGGRPDLAFLMTRNSVHQILDRGAVGTQSELLDAIAHPGEKEPRLSGTFSQAWNLAEFIRNFYDDYLGVRLEHRTHRLLISPRLPPGIRTAGARLNADGSGILLNYSVEGNLQDLRLSSEGLAEDLRVNAVLPMQGDSTLSLAFPLSPFSEIRIQVAGRVVNVLDHGTPIRYDLRLDPRPKESHLPAGLALATPVLRTDLKCLAGPGYPLLPHTTVVRRNPGAHVLLDAVDPAADDTGRTGYTPPRSHFVVKGSFDLRRVTLAADDSCSYWTLTFQRLSNPGWHPEYGFQLTFVAIALDTDGVAGTGQMQIGRNARYVLAGGKGYEKVIYIGGGVNLEDAAGKILAAYVPAAEDAAAPFGDASTGTIHFAIPLSLLGRPKPGWTLTIVAGAQDDHGGAGIGEFRTVNREQGEWNGGGRKGPDDPNVYDDMIVRVAP